MRVFKFRVVKGYIYIIGMWQGLAWVSNFQVHVLVQGLLWLEKLQIKNGKEGRKGRREGGR